MSKLHPIAQVIAIVLIAVCCMASITCMYYTEAARIKAWNELYTPKVIQLPR